MPGNHIGGLKTREKNLAKDPDYYKNLGRLGGSSGKGPGYAGGFSAYLHCSCDIIDQPHHKGQCAGKIGGRISRRKAKNANVTN